MPGMDETHGPAAVNTWCIQTTISKDSPKLHKAGQLLRNSETKVVNSLNLTHY